jgi:hypothetical protein
MTTEIETGGPAYPLLAEQAHDGWAAEGMTLRDHFAGLAMQGFISRDGIYNDTGETGTPEIHDGWFFSKCAKSSYDMADAMLKARK